MYACACVRSHSLTYYVFTGPYLATTILMIPHDVFLHLFVALSSSDLANDTHGVFLTSIFCGRKVAAYHVYVYIYTDTHTWTHMYSVSWHVRVIYVSVAICREDQPAKAAETHVYTWQYCIGYVYEYAWTDISSICCCVSTADQGPLIIEIWTDTSVCMVCGWSSG
jgi:hypothetical protein